MLDILEADSAFTGYKEIEIGGMHRKYHKDGLTFIEYLFFRLKELFSEIPEARVDNAFEILPYQTKGFLW